MLDQEKIKPQLKTFDLTMIVVGLVIGMGIFRNPVEVANKAGIPIIFFLAWITGAVISFIGALTFAEIGSRYPVAGGFYKIFSHCYHPAFAFMVNWIIVMSNAGATALVAIMGAEYIAPILLPDIPRSTAISIITISSIAGLWVINMVGIKVSAKLLNGLMLIKIAMLLLLISAVFLIKGAPNNPIITPDNPPLKDMATCFALCFIPVFFTYGGYQMTMNFGNDIQHARKTMPRAIFFGITIILLLYLAVNFSYFKVLGFSGLQNSKTLASDICGLIFGAVAYKLVAVVMFLSVMAYVNVELMSNPRIYFAMADDKILPPIFKRLNHKTQVQEFALTLFCVFILLTLFFMNSFKALLEYVMFFDSISLIAAASAIFILRYRDKKAEITNPNPHPPTGIFKIKGYPYLPALYIMVYLIVNISVLYANPEAAMWGFILFISGLPLYYLIKYILNRNADKV